MGHELQTARSADLALTPDTAGARLESLAQSCGIGLDVTRGYSGALPGLGCWLRSVSVSDHGDPATWDLRCADVVRRIGAELMQPAATDELDDALIALDVATAKRAGGDLDAAARLRVYRDQLARYPRDVALTVVRGWPEQRGDAGKWWPTAAELHKLLEQGVAERRAVIAALRRSRRGDDYESRTIPAPEMRRVQDGFARLLADLTGGKS